MNEIIIEINYLSKVITFNDGSDLCKMLKNGGTEVAKRTRGSIASRGRIKYLIVGLDRNTIWLEGKGSTNHIKSHKYKNKIGTLTRCDGVLLFKAWGFAYTFLISYQ